MNHSQFTRIHKAWSLPQYFDTRIYFRQKLNGTAQPNCVNVTTTGCDVPWGCAVKEFVVFCFIILPRWFGERISRDTVYVDIFAYIVYIQSSNVYTTMPVRVNVRDSGWLLCLKVQAVILE